MSQSNANGRSGPEVLFALAVITAEIAAVGRRFGLWGGGALAVPFGLAAFTLAEQVTRPRTRFVNYYAADRAGVVHYVGKSRAFAQRAAQHKADATGGRNGAPRHGKDWAVVLNEGGQLTPFEHYRSEPQSLRVERRITYTVGVFVTTGDRFGAATGTLPPRLWGNRANTAHRDGLRPWEWAALPGLLVGYAFRLALDPTFPRWTRWTPR